MVVCWPHLQSSVLRRSFASHLSQIAGVVIAAIIEVMEAHATKLKSTWHWWLSNKYGSARLQSDGAEEKALQHSELALKTLAPERPDSFEAQSYRQVIDIHYGEIAQQQALSCMTASLPPIPDLR